MAGPPPRSTPRVIVMRSRSGRSASIVAMGKISTPASVSCAVSASVAGRQIAAAYLDVLQRREPQCAERLPSP